MCVRLTKLGEILTSDVISILTGIRGTREEVAVDIVRKAGSDLKEEERRLRNIHSGRRKGRKKARTAQTSRLGYKARQGKTENGHNNGICMYDSKKKR